MDVYQVNDCLWNFGRPQPGYRVGGLSVSKTEKIRRTLKVQVRDIQARLGDQDSEGPQDGGRRDTSMICIYLVFAWYIP